MSELLLIFRVSLIEEMISSSSHSDRELAVRFDLVSVGNSLLMPPLSPSNLLGDPADGVVFCVDEVEEGLGLSDSDSEGALGFDTLCSVDGTV